MKMESIESTYNYLLESSMANATTTLLDEESTKDETMRIFLESAENVYQIVSGLITVTGLVGNILTVAVILRKKGIKSITDILVLNLAVPDILFCVVCVSIRLVEFVIPTLQYDDIWCKLLIYVIYACSYASMYVLVLISLDRYLALVHPIRVMPFRTKRNCYILIIVIWSIVLLGNIHMLFENQFCPGVEKKDELSMRMLDICFFVFGFMLPLLLMCILYGRILKSLHTAKIPGVNNTTSRVRLISNRRVTKMVIIAMMVFIICRLPFHILSLYEAFVNYVVNIDVSFIIYIVFSCMLCLNCCINPILYSFHSETFRKGLRDVLSCKA